MRETEQGMTTTHQMRQVKRCIKDQNKIKNASSLVANVFCLVVSFGNKKKKLEEQIQRSNGCDKEVGGGGGGGGGEGEKDETHKTVKQVNYRVLS